MRSRYTAYALKNSDYLLRSWHPDYRPASISFVSNQKWLGLKIKSVQDGGLDSDKGTVEFIARFKVSGRAERLHEVSRFEKQDDHWLYCDGELLE
jgi:SEC-C motif-containing protein|tara:strand:- start:165 stop:449 length:285 start_codon:yes stop_codon:yes gene_type:complete